MEMVKAGLVTLALLCVAVVCDDGPYKFNTLPLLSEPTTFAQYTGHIVVNETYNSALFYWFFESQSAPETDPLVLWMTGGPGCSSELAVFYENGPFYFQDDGQGSYKVILSNYSWNRNSNIIYIDQPAGTGFSYTGVNGYVHNEKQMAVEMYIFLQKWLQTFPEYIGRPFYLFGESYAGHYVPSVGYTILQGNQDPQNIFIPLVSISVGNGMTSPIIQYGSYGPYAVAHAMIDKETALAVQAQYAICQGILNGTRSGSPEVSCNIIISMISTAAGPFNTYDVTKTCPPDLALCYNFTLANEYLNRKDVQQTLHVSRKWKMCSTLVHEELAKDWWSRQDYLVPDLLSAGVGVNIYDGINGFICNFIGQEMWTNQLSWNHQSDFLAAPREIWMVDGIIAGYRQSAYNLSMITVNNAGHMVPMDQPKNAFDMFTRILTGQSFGDAPASR